MSVKVPSALKEHMQDMVRESTVEIHRACSANMVQVKQIFSQIYNDGPIDTLFQNSKLSPLRIAYLHNLYLSPDTTARISEIGQAEILQKFQKKMVKFTSEVLETLDSATPPQPATQPAAPLQSSSSNYRYHSASLTQPLDNVIRDTLVDNILESTRGSVNAIDCSLNQVLAALQITLNNCKARNVTSNRGSIKANNTSFTTMESALDISLENCQGITANSSRGSISAKKSQLEKCTAALNIDLNESQAKLVESNRGSLNAQRSTLLSVAAALNVSLSLCDAQRVESSRGSIEWNGALSNTQIQTIQGALAVALHNLTAKSIVSERGGVTLVGCTAEEIKSAQDAHLQDTYATQIQVSRGELKLTKSFVTQAHAVKQVTLSDSTIEELHLEIPQGGEGSIVVIPQKKGTINNIVVKVQKSSQIFPGVTASITMNNNIRIGSVKTVGFLVTGGGSSTKRTMTREELNDYVLKGAGWESGDVLSVGIMSFEGGEFSIQNNRVTVVKHPPNWQISPSSSSIPKAQEESLVILRISGITVENSIRFEGCKGKVISEGATVRGNVIGGVSNL